MPPRQSELTVIVKAKDLASYILTITQKSPKRFRFTLVAKLQAYALDTIESLFRANEVYVSPGDATAAASRLELQRQAQTSLKLLAYMAQLAMEQGCILPRQYEQISRKVYDCRNLCGAWMNADRNRLAPQPAPVPQPAPAPASAPSPPHQTRQPTLFDVPPG